MIIARMMLALGLGGFWIMAGQITGYEFTGFVLGVMGAAFIFAWTHPDFVQHDDYN